MTARAAPRAVAETLLSRIDAGQWHDLAALCAEHAVVDQPFALPEPMRIEGREAIARHFAMAAKMPLSMRVQNARFAEAVEGETVIAEYDYELIRPGGECLARVANIQVLRVVDGLIASSRDYHDHHRIGAAFAASR